jgi:hypothetical protein
MALQFLRLAGRCANGAERDGGSKYHAVAGYVALCGAKPGRRSAGWSLYPGDMVTCPRCRRKLEADDYDGPEPTVNNEIV